MTLPSAELRATFPPTLEALESFCAEFRRWRAAACRASDGFSTELLLREVITNSVEHGCPGDLNKRIHCVVRAKRGRLLIAVQDEGDGFDWHAAWHQRAEAGDSSGRGIEILRSYADRVHFNVKGNAVALIKRF